MIFPLITTPYISGILGATNIGKVNFATSVVGWFVIITSFGVQAYGVKEVAKIRNDKLKLSKFVSEMTTIELTTTVITTAVYAIAILIIPRFAEEKLVFIIMCITLLLNVFSYDWFFQGVEEFTYITIRSLLFKVIAIIAMFLLVKKEGDYVIYAGISVFALSAANILNLLYCKKFINWKRKGLELKKHLKPLGVFF